jgi:3-hydroxyisobutyrate dehydrogenase-like beta-hydroxyacid dehydrogenase
MRGAGPMVQSVGTAQDVAAAADIILSIITDDAGVRQVYRGERGLLSAPVQGKLFIEMSTLQPATVRELAVAAQSKGAALIDSPVLGSIPTVKDGNLLALVGGQEADIVRACTVLDLLTRRVAVMGAVGSGCATKLAVNLGLATYLQSLSESLALAIHQGVASDQVLNILSEAPTANAILASKMAALLGGEVSITLDIATLRKDVMSAVATAALSGVPSPCASAALSSLSVAVAAGWGPRDIGELPRFFREMMLQRFVA